MRFTVSSFNGWLHASESMVATSQNTCRGLYLWEILLFWQKQVSAQIHGNSGM
jgi:hypothetical protein